jgi:beta-glucanase (GH16 family)
MTKRTVLLGVPLLLIAALLWVIGVRATAASVPGPLAWSDEFNGPAGSAPNPSSWRLETGGSGWGNEELETYTSGTANAAQDGAGNLVITARKEQTGTSCWYGPCQYTSARLITESKFAQAYGRFEARIKIPRGQGMWPAFWLLGDDIYTAGWPNSGEIDVMENIGKEPGTTHGSLHSPGHSGANSLTAAYTLPNGKALADDFHVYGVDWKPDSITWSVDGRAYATKTRADVGSNPWPFDHPFFAILNVAVGGGWPGSPDASTSFPQRMLVDYVRVYRLASTTSATGSTSVTTTSGTTSAATTSAASAATAATASSIRGLGGKCVTLPGSGADGTQLQMWDCTGASNQSWTFPGDGTVTALGKCLDLAWGSPDNGARIQAATCNGGSAQQFRLTAGSDLVNPGTDKCVDVVNASTAPGAPLQQWACAGSQNQKFWRQ